jgi:polyvinyl alcohol dehydrogenase (cytochrome)
VHRRPNRPGPRHRSRPALALALAVALALVAGSCGWSSYGFDGANSRTTPFETDISPANAATLVEKWRIDGIKGVTSTPAVLGDRVYFGAWDGTVRAVDTETGAPVWTTPVTTGVSVLGAMVDDSPLLFDGKVIIGDGAGRLHALDAHTGALLWTQVLDSHPNARIFSSPVLAGGNVVVGVGSYELAFEKPTYTFKGAVVALDPATGAERWRFFTTNDDATSGAGASVWSTAAVDHTRKLIYIGVGQAYEEPAGPYTDSLLALDYRTGALAWHRQFTDDDVYRIFRTPVNGPDADVGAAPNLFTIGDRDVVGVGDKAGVYSVLDRTTGATVWARQLTAGSHLGGVMLTAAVHDGVIYVSSNEMLGSVIDFANPANTSVTFALDADDGSVIWDTDVPHASFGALTLANGVLYQPTIPGSYQVLDAADGSIIDTLTPMAGAQLGGGATLQGGTLFAPYGMWFFTEASGQKGGLVAYELPGD